MQTFCALSRKKLIRAAVLISIILSLPVLIGAGENDHLPIVELRVPDTAPVVRLEEIRQYIAENGLEWEAGLTPKALLPVEDKMRLLGNLIVPGLGGPVINMVPGALPDQLDWRNFGGRDVMTPVKDQGTCGGCSAFAALGTVEAAFKFTHGEELDLSEQHLIANGRICCDQCGDCDGGWSDSSFTFIILNGILDEASMPFDDTNVTCRAASDWQDHVQYPLDHYFKIEPDGREAYMQALVDYG
ncbi:MAG: hypothetical protein KOO63_16080, partial [Bacteroidales bacterium]|nr:hypothetical protein [Candidatus Latescibacterota bacterium]